MSFDPYEATAKDPYEAARDPFEMTTRDPLEDTVPDPAEPPGRVSRRTRRALEAAALLILAPGLIAVRWVDDSHQAALRQPPDHVTVLRRGATGTLGHTRWHLLGRDATAPVRDSTLPAGTAKLTLVLRVRALDAQGVKDADSTAYQLTDRAGHVWTALGLLGTEGRREPVAGGETPVTVTATVPERLLNSVALEIRQPTLRATAGAPVEVVRFAH
jgi:hypothetical protein